MVWVRENPTPVPPRAERMKWLQWLFRSCMAWASSRDMQYILWSISERVVSRKWQVRVPASWRDVLPYPGYNFWSEIPGKSKSGAVPLLPPLRQELSLPPHECLVHGWAQVKDVVADGQVVLQPEGLQDNPVPHRERQAQLVVVVGWDRRGRESVNFPFSICSATIMFIFIQNSNKLHSDLLLGLT